MGIFQNKIKQAENTDHSGGQNFRKNIRRVLVLGILYIFLLGLFTLLFNHPFS